MIWLFRVSTDTCYTFSLAFILGQVKNVRYEDLLVWLIVRYELLK